MALAKVGWRQSAALLWEMGRRGARVALGRWGRGDAGRAFPAPNGFGGGGFEGCPGWRLVFVEGFMDLFVFI